MQQTSSCCQENRVPKANTDGGLPPTVYLLKEIAAATRFLTLTYFTFQELKFGRPRNAALPTGV